MTLQAQDIQALQAAAASMGLELPSMAYIVGAVLFSTIGFVAWRYGRKRQLTRVKWLGVGLMFYGYFAFETWILYAVGVALCAALYVWRSD
jgi:hypothetical protein